MLIAFRFQSTSCVVFFFFFDRLHVGVSLCVFYCLLGYCRVICAWSGDVIMSRGFLVFPPLFLSAWSICWQPSETSVLFITTKTSNIGGFL